MSNWAVLLISGRGLDPNEVNRILSIKADKIRTNDMDGIVIWQLNSTLEGNSSLMDHIEDILKRIYPVRKQIYALSKKYQISLVCNVDIEESKRKVLIPPKYLVILGYIGAQLEIYV